MATEPEVSTTTHLEVNTNKSDEGEGKDNKDGEKSKGDEPSTSTTGSFECNICLDQAHDAVVSKCGHLFCWPCLHQWLETRPNNRVCPVCKAAISKDSVIPLYGRGGDHKEDPRLKTPPRPPGQRTEPTNTRQNPLGGLFNHTASQRVSNFQMSIGIGAFPFGIFSTAFIGGNNDPDGEGEGNPSDIASANDAENLSRLFLGMAIFFIIWLLIT